MNGKEEITLKEAEKTKISKPPITDKIGIKKVESKTKKKKESKTKKKLRNSESETFNKFSMEIIDSGITNVINNTILNDHKEQISIKEVNSAQFSKYFMETLNYYFPDMSLDHPLYGLGMATLVLGTTIVQKKQGGLTDEGKIRADAARSRENIESKTDSNDSTNNPYTAVADKQ